MFDDTIGFLKRLERGMQVPIEMPLDEEGYLDRQCPKDECHAEFKVLFEDWREKVREEIVYCPMCRHKAESGKWNTPEQERYIEEYGTRYVSEQIDKTLKRDAAQFNRRQPKGGFIQMSMSVKPGRPPIAVPAEVAELMQQKFACEECGCQYGSVGSSFFCPACGHNSAPSTFAGTVRTVRTLMQRLDKIAGAIPDKDSAEDAVRQILENSLQRLVGGFQRLMEALFDKLPQAARIQPRRNVFQNLRESSDLWEKAGLKRYENLLTEEELRDLNRLFQQRHLCAHRDGIVDQAYLDKSQDTSYTAGQRVVVKPASVHRLGDLVEKIGEAKSTEVQEHLTRGGSHGHPER